MYVIFECWTADDAMDTRPDTLYSYRSCVLRCNIIIMYGKKSCVPPSTKWRSTSVRTVSYRLDGNDRKYFTDGASRQRGAVYVRRAPVYTISCFSVRSDTRILYYVSRLLVDLGLDINIIIIILLSSRPPPPPPPRVRFKLLLYTAASGCNNNIIIIIIIIIITQKTDRLKSSIVMT